MTLISNDDNCIIVPVSKFCQTNIENFFKNKNINLPKINCIYNCVFTKHFINKNYSINIDNVVFASAWHKGLKKIIELFDKLVINYPNFKLILMRPNYNKSEVPDRHYIILLDTINTKQELSEIIGSSLCVLTSEFPETFGNLFAESYYLNTPVIATNKINGLHEFIDNSHICNFNNYNEFENLIISFYKNRPAVSLNNRFYEDNVINEWINLFTNL
jgi:glycosyltransferase involved in cell wall biosynthesis